MRWNSTALMADAPTPCGRREPPSNWRWSSRQQRSWNERISMGRCRRPPWTPDGSRSPSAPAPQYLIATPTADGGPRFAPDHGTGAPGIPGGRQAGRRSRLECLPGRESHEADGRTAPSRPGAIQPAAGRGMRERGACLELELQRRPRAVRLHRRIRGHHHEPTGAPSGRAAHARPVGARQFLVGQGGLRVPGCRGQRLAHARQRMA